MGANVQFHQEYLIFDTLSLIGTVGGTLGLFVGFSFYYFVVMLIDFSLTNGSALEKKVMKSESLIRKTLHFRRYTNQWKQFLRKTR